jgi:hypothetical protein
MIVDNKEPASRVLLLEGLEVLKRDAWLKNLFKYRNTRGTMPILRFGSRAMRRKRTHGFRRQRP